MALGGGFAATMPSPVHTGGDQRNRRRVDQVNRTLEPAGKSFAGFTTDKTRREIAQVFQDRPEESLGHLGGSDLVGVGKIIAAGRSRPSQAGQRTGMQVQRITHIIESDAVGQLGIEQGDDVAPRAEGANFLLNSRFSSELWNQ